MGKLFNTAVIVICVAFGYSIWERYKLTSGLSSVVVTEHVKEVYDYVVIGSGSAGSVIGSRLSESNVTVLILEAGNHFDENPNIHIPALAGSLLHSDIDWRYESEPETDVYLGLAGHRLVLPRGRTLGGTSAINYCTLVRGSPHLYDEWVTKCGCEGWGFQDLLPYFKKFEDVKIPEFEKNSEYRSTGGPIAVSRLYGSPLEKYFLEAGQEMGYNYIDHNGPTQTGFSNIQYTIRDGVRSSTGLEYLGNIKQRENLDISINSFVTKINIVKQSANGVYFIKNGRKRYVKANKEVILSAGSFNSPKILMLSGIGPKEHLEDLGIQVVADLPVGQKMDDHVGMVLSATITEPLSITGAMFQSIWWRIQYILFGTGPLAFTNNISQGFVHVDKTKIDKEKPDAQFMFVGGIIPENAFQNYMEPIAKELVYPFVDTHGFSTLVMLLQPESAGRLTLRSTDPFDNPVIKTNQFSNENDINKMISIIKIYEEFLSTKSMQSIGADLKISQGSFCSQYKFQSDDFWRCMLRHIGISFSHTTSTCRMGPRGDKSAVVDLELKVQGVNNLRVVDASVFPSTTTGNTNAPTIAVAEKAADMIRANWKKSH